MPDEQRAFGIKTTIRSVPPDQDGANPPAARTGLVIRRWEREKEGPMVRKKKPITPEDPARRAGLHLARTSTYVEVEQIRAALSVLVNDGLPLPGLVVKAQPRWWEGQGSAADASALNMLTDQTWTFFQAGGA